MNVDEGGNGLVVTLLWSFFKGASSSTDLHRELLTAGVTDKLAGLLLHILGGARGLVHCPALFGTLTIAHLFDWPVALPHCLVVCLLLERDLALLLEILLAHFLLAGLELGDIGVVALLSLLVGALQDGFLLQTGHLRQLLDTAQPSLAILLTIAEVDPGTSSSSS